MWLVEKRWWILWEERKEGIRCMGMEGSEGGEGWGGGGCGEGVGRGGRG